MFFVYYRDGYDNNGDVGLAEFVYEEDALTFINDRLNKKDEERTLEMYTLIEGKKLEVVPQEVITKLKVDYT